LLIVQDYGPYPQRATFSTSTSRRYGSRIRILIKSHWSAASALPFFVLALPAGSIRDIFDRRKLILQTEVWMLGMAVVLAATITTHTTTSALSEESWSLERFLVKTDWESNGKP
jgi:hypothetical protein